MARQENDREDLLAEATALVERVELAVDGFEQPLVAGFRRDGSASFYFGADPAYHFNSLEELRRGYVEGLLYKAERIHGTKQGRLVSLKRYRVADEVRLLRHDLTADETNRFLDALVTRLTVLRGALEQGRYRIAGQVPADANVVERLRALARAASDTGRRRFLAARSVSAFSAYPNTRQRWTCVAFRWSEGRNDPCPCGSGKKFKKCCGQKKGVTGDLDARELE